MRCFNCGAVLKSTDYCGQCGTDVRLYRRMLQLSNAYYNAGLEKAKVRDLSGAVHFLRQSLKLNKKNTDARNLLGLVYFELGEVVDALSQWIISKSYQSKKNLASYYIDEVQNNPARLEMINTAIKKYNQSLVYCEQGSYDLAIIQLKKILSTYGNLVKGHQLLALLYMKEEKYSRARSELKKILEIDRTNTVAMHYTQELEAAAGKTAVKEEAQSGKDAIAYTSGNETIIQPIGVKDNSGLHSIINVVIGIAIGAAVVGFLVLPAREHSANDELNKAIADYSDQVESKTAALENLEKEMESLREETESAKQTAEETTQQLAGYEALLKAYGSYSADDFVQALEQLESIDKESLSDDGRTLYDAVFSEVGAEAVSDLYKTGYDAYQSRDYDTAISDLEKCYNLDNTQGDALYFLARAYHQRGTAYQQGGEAENAKTCFDNAKTYYQKVIDEFPNTKKATDASGFLNGLQ